MNAPRSFARTTPRVGIAIAAALVASACTTATPHDAQQELAEAERAFARMGASAGVRDAFIAWFAPDGLVFEPAPVVVRNAWPARAARPQPSPERLEWQPELVHVARSGDLGYSTGPFRVVERDSGTVKAHGAFFSVWQRQPDDEWRVWLDLGARTASPVDAATWQVRPRVDPGARGAPIDAPLELDRALSALSPAAFARMLAHDARRHRDLAVPLIGAAWVAATEREAATTTYTPIDARVARSGDFAATHGTLARRSAGGTSTGRYVHVWLRDAGPWQLAVEAVLDDE